MSANDSHLGPTAQLAELARMLEAQTRAANVLELVEDARRSNHADPILCDALAAEARACLRACAPPRGAARALDPEVAR